MNQFFELLISGISLGFVYALIALGFVIIFKSTRVVNFAHGSLVLIGAYTIARAQDSLGFVPAVLLGVAVTALAALIVQVVILRRISGAPQDILAICTIGVDILLATELTRRIGTKVLNIGDPWHDNVVHFLGLSIPQARVAAGVVAILLLAAFLTAFKFTDWGVSMRSAASDGEAAAMMGIRLRTVSALAWAVAGALAAVGGVFF